MKKRTWIHFVGANYYSIDKFIKEANTVGIARAIAPQVLKKMSTGDVVLLAQKVGKSTRIFGYFTFNEMTGLDPELVQELKRRQIIKAMPALEPMNIQRGCGSYTITGSFAVADSESMMDLIRETDDKKIGRVMIGGKFHYLKDAGMDVDYVLCEIPFRKGFRAFDFATFKSRVDERLQTLKPGHHVKLKGQFYSDLEDFEMVPVDLSQFFEIQNYNLN
jgi:hypothetical protein